MWVWVWVWVMMLVASGAFFKELNAVTNCVLKATSNNKPTSFKG